MRVAAATVAFAQNLEHAFELVLDLLADSPWLGLAGMPNESIEASIIRPLTRFPSSHYLRSNPVCGQTLGE